MMVNVAGGRALSAVNGPMASIFMAVAVLWMVSKNIEGERGRDKYPVKNSCVGSKEAC